MDWLYYLLEANAYLGVFYAFYYFVLKREPLYTINRWYLLVIPFLSFALPLFSVNSFATQSHLTVPLPVAMIYDQRPSVPVAATQHLEQINVTATVWELNNTLPFLYFAVVLFFVAIMLGQVKKLVMLYLRASKHRENGVVYISLSHDKEEIFSFFNWLFLHPKMAKDRAIIAHELIHIKQKHTYDVLILEFVRCVNWFNPVTYLLCKDAKLNHEYIADRCTSSLMQNRYDYANLLIKYAYLPSENLSHSAFSKTQLEQRIEQLGKPKARTTGKLKYLIIVPLVILLFFISAFKVEKSYGWLSINVNIPSAKTLVGPAAIAKQANNIGRQQKTAPLSKPADGRKPAPILSEQPLSELVIGPTTMDKLSAMMAKKGKKLYALDYELYWAQNRTNTKIRNVIHSICIGTEAQLFRGKQADTLYIDRGYYTVDKGTVRIKTDNLWIGAPDYTAQQDKELIIVDAALKKFIKRVNRVDIITTGMIHSMVLNPYYGYGKNGVTDSVPSKYVDVKKRDAGRRYISNVSNIYVREARVTGNEIITNETKPPNEDQRQPGIIW